MRRIEDLYEIQCKRNQKLNARLIEVTKRMRKAEACLRMLKKLPIEIKKKEDSKDAR